MLITLNINNFWPDCKRNGPLGILWEIHSINKAIQDADDDAYNFKAVSSLK